MKMLSFFGRSNRQASTAGFTLIELLVVLAIIGVLTTIVFAAVSKVKRVANGSKSVSNLRTLGQAALRFAADHEMQLPYYQEPVSSYKPNPSYRLWWFQYLVRDFCNGNYDLIHDPNDNFKTSTGAARYQTMNTTTGKADLTYSYAMNTCIPVPAPGTMSAAEKNARMCRLAWLERPGQTAFLLDTCEAGAIGPTTESTFRYSVNSTTCNVLFCDGSVRTASRDLLLQTEAKKDPETLRQHRQFWYGDPTASKQIAH